MDISVILSGYGAGFPSHPTLQSIARAATFARKQNLSVEILVVLDRMDLKALEYVSRYGNDDIRIVWTDCPDTSASRNQSVSAACGAYVAFTAAGNLPGGMWLGEAHARAVTNNRRALYYPEYVVCFGAVEVIIRLKDVFSHYYHPCNVFVGDHWCPLNFFAPRSLLLENPFEENDYGEGLRYGDRLWLGGMLKQGVFIESIPNTVVFTRTRHDQRTLSRMLAKKQGQAEEVYRQMKATQAQINALLNSRIYRLGRFLSLPVRALRNIVDYRHASRKTL